MIKITVIGTGYVGLVTGTCFSETGAQVTCIDIDKEKIRTLKKGQIPIYEPGLQEILIRNIKKNRLRFHTSLNKSDIKADMIFICVGTPPDETGRTDLSAVYRCLDDIADVLTGYCIIVVKSTVPVGTCQKIHTLLKTKLKERNKDIEFDIVSNPEFLKEGDSVNDFMKPDRIIVGCDTPRPMPMIKKLYEPFTQNGHPIIFMDTASSEMTKYAANAMLATKISFMNEIAGLCEKTGADVTLVRQGIGSDPRIGPQFIHPGIGFGGSCFPKDIDSLIYEGARHSNPMKVLQAVKEVNNRQKTILFGKIRDAFKNDLNGKIIAVWGLSFKPNTDDMREASSIALINCLLEAGCHIHAYDPIATANAKKIFGDTIHYFSNQYEALKHAHCLVICTEWQEFRFPDFGIMKKNLLNPLIFDGRNIYNPAELKTNGFGYYGIGIHA